MHNELLRGRKSPKPIPSICRDGKNCDDDARERKVPSSHHQLKVGISGKLYSPFDFVTPIIDSMTRLNERAHGTGMARIVQCQERQKVRELLESSRSVGPSLPSYGEFEIDEHSSNTVQYSFTRPNATKAGSICAHCNTTKPGAIRIDHSSGHMVCEECGAEGECCRYGSDYKDTHDTDKSKARADTDNNTNKIHEIRLLGNHVGSTGTSIPTYTKKKNKLGYAQEQCNKEAEQADELNLSKTHNRKLTSIIEAVDDFITEMAPVDNSIARRLRMDASWIFRQSVKHYAMCGKKECQRALFNKPARVIARESFSYTIDKISASDGFDGVSKQTVVSLQQRVHSSHVFNHIENATQHQSCLAMISAISTGDNCIVCPDASADDARKTLEPARSQAISDQLSTGHVPLRRQESDVLSSPLMQMRDAIRRLSIEYSYSTEVREAAMCALQDSEFSKHIVEAPVTPRKATNFASAYVLLRSVSEEIGKINASTSQEEQCRKVGLAGSDVESMVRKMRVLLPKAVMVGCSGDYDELY